MLELLSRECALEIFTHCDAAALSRLEQSCTSFGPPRPPPSLVQQAVRVRLAQCAPGASLPIQSWPAHLQSVERAQQLDQSETFHAKAIELVDEFGEARNELLSSDELEEPERYERSIKIWHTSMERLQDLVSPYATTVEYVDDEAHGADHLGSDLMHCALFGVVNGLRTVTAEQSIRVFEYSGVEQFSRTLYLLNVLKIAICRPAPLDCVGPLNLSRMTDRAEHAAITRAISCGAADPLKRILQHGSHDDDDILKGLAADCLAVVAERPVYYKQWITKDILMVLVQLLRSISDPQYISSVVALICQIVAMELRNGVATLDQTWHSLKGGYADTLVKEGVVEELIRCLSNEELIEFDGSDLVYTLSDLAFDVWRPANNFNRVLPAVPVIVPFLTSDDSNMSEAATVAMGSFANSKQGIEAMLTEGAWRPLVAMASEDISDLQSPIPASKGSALNALGYIATNSPQHVPSLIKDGIADVCTATMDIFALMLTHEQQHCTDAFNAFMQEPGAKSKDDWCYLVCDAALTFGRILLQCKPHKPDATCEVVIEHSRLGMMQSLLRLYKTQFTRVFAKNDKLDIDELLSLIDHQLAMRKDVNSKHRETRSRASKAKKKQ